MDHVSNSLWTVLLRKMRGQIQFRADGKWRNGFIWFSDGLWQIFLNDIEEYQLLVAKTKQNRKVTKIAAKIEEYHKLYARENFEKFVAQNANECLALIDELVLEYNYSTRKLRYSAHVKVE